MAIPRPSPWLSLLLAALSLMALAWTESTHSALTDAQATSALTNRVTALEAHQGDVKDQLSRMEAALTRLTDWAMGPSPSKP